MITGYIKGQNLTIRTPMIAADTIDYLTAQFVFQTVDWEGCRLFSHWKCGETNYTIELSDAGKIEKEQHLNLTAGTWTVWIHGEQYRDGELIQRITTDEATLTVKATGTAGGSPFPEVPASDLERINAQIAELQDKVGSGGGDASGKAEKPVMISVDLAEDNSFVIPGHTAEELLEMAQNGAVRLTAYRANEDGSAVILMADIHGDFDTNDGVLYTLAADTQITSVPVLVGLNTSNENTTNGAILEAPAAGVSSANGALNLYKMGLNGDLTDTLLTKVYTYEDVRAALLDNRPITMTTYSDGGGLTYGMYHVVPGASLSKDIRFIGFEWTTNRGYDDEPLPDLGWTPKSAVLAEDGTLTFEDEWFEGYAKQTEVDQLSEAIADLPKSDDEEIDALIDADLLPTTTDSNGKILTDSNGNVILRY